MYIYIYVCKRYTLHRYTRLHTILNHMETWLTFLQKGIDWGIPCMMRWREGVLGGAGPVTSGYIIIATGGLNGNFRRSPWLYPIVNLTSPSIKLNYWEMFRKIQYIVGNSMGYLWKIQSAIRPWIYLDTGIPQTAIFSAAMEKKNGNMSSKR